MILPTSSRPSTGAGAGAGAGAAGAAAGAGAGAGAGAAAGAAAGSAHASWRFRDSVWNQHVVFLVPRRTRFGQSNFSDPTLCVTT